MTSLRLLCLFFFLCILEQSKAQYDNHINRPSIFGNLLRMGGDFKYQLADTADNAVNTVRGIFKGGSNAVLDNTRRVSSSLDKSLDSTDTFVRAGLDAGKNYVDTGYTILSTAPRTANDAVYNSVNEIRNPYGAGEFYAGKLPNVGLEGSYRQPRIVPHLELVTATGERYELNDQDVRHILYQMIERDKVNANSNGGQEYSSPTS